MTLHSVRQRLGSVMMLRDRGELRTDFGPLWLTVTYQPPSQQRGQSIGKPLIDAQADGDLATPRAHDLPVARAQFAADDLAGAIDDLATRLP